VPGPEEAASSSSLPPHAARETVITEASRSAVIFFILTTSHKWIPESIKPENVVFERNRRAFFAQTGRRDAFVFLKILP